MMWLSTSTLKDLLPVGVLVLLLSLRILGICCCAPSTTRARVPTRVHRFHLVIASLGLGLGCSAAALLLEASPGSVVWPPPPRAIAAAVAWAALWPIAALVIIYELRVEPTLLRRRAGILWLLLACAARVVPLALGLLSSTGSRQLLPWLPVQATLLLAACLLAVLMCAAVPRRGGGSLLGPLVVEPLNTRTAPDERTAGAEDNADAQAEAAAMELQRVEWTEEQREHERLAPRGAGCWGFLSAFHKLHLSFLSEAKELQKATDLKKHGKKPTEPAADEGYTMSDSVRSLPRQLWAQRARLRVRVRVRVWVRVLVRVRVRVKIRVRVRASVRARVRVGLTRARARARAQAQARTRCARCGATCGPSAPRHRSSSAAAARSC